MEKLKVLVVGAGMYVCGKGTNDYGTILPALYEFDTKNLLDSIAVCATSKKSLRELKRKNYSLSKIFKRKLDLKTFPKKKLKDNSSYIEAVSSEKYDCAIVSVPDHLHYKIARFLVNKGINVLLVKPFTPDTRTAADLINITKKKGVYGAVEFHKRFDMANILIRDIINDGKLGKPLYFHVEFSQKKIVSENTFSAWIDKTDIFQYLGVHYVDLIYFLTGALPVRVISIGQKSYLKNKGINAYDAIQTVIEWQKNNYKFSSTILTNWIDPNNTSAMSDQKIKLIAENGRIESDQKNRGLQIVDDVNGISDVNPYFSKIHSLSGNNKDNKFDGYGYESISSFLSDVYNLKNHKIDLKSLMSSDRPTFNAGIVSTAVVEASRKSLISNSKWININRTLLKRCLIK